MLGFEFRQSSFTHRERVVRMPCPPTLSDMHRLPGMLGLLRVSPPDMPVTQEPLLSSSCLQQGYHNAPHGAHQYVQLVTAYGSPLPLFPRLRGFGAASAHPTFPFNVSGEFKIVEWKCHILLENTRA